MTPEDEKGIPSDAAEWHPNPQSAVERFQPTPENPIQEIRIGLWQTLGQVERVTRVVMILKDGRTADMPWEEAEPLLPPEFRVARELGDRARRLERQASNFADSIRSGTDVMERSGHLKDALLRPFGAQRPALRSLVSAEDLAREISEIAQESFLELRRMTNAHESHAEEIQNLAERLDGCERRLEHLRADTFRQIPKVQAEYDQVYRRLAKKSKRLESGSDTGIPESEETKDDPTT